MPVSISLRPLCLGLAALGLLGACSPAPAPVPAAPEVPQAPTVPDAPAVPEVPEAPATAAEADAHTNEAAPDADAHDDDGHDHHDHHDHDHDHAGGEAHVHGLADAAIVLEGSRLTVSIETPLASLGASEKVAETEAELAEQDALRTSLADPGPLVLINAEAGCMPSESDVSIRKSGDHGSVDVSWAFECQAPAELRSIDFALMTTFPTLERIDAVLIDGASQFAVEITPATRRVTWP